MIKYKVFSTAIFVLLTSTIRGNGLADAEENPQTEAQKMYFQLFTEDDSGYNPLRIATPYDEYIATCSEGCANGSLFSSFRPECIKAVRTVADLFMAIKNASSLLEFARKLKRHPTLHPMVWYTAVTMVTLERPDLRQIWKPSPVDITPESYLNCDAIRQARSNPDECVLLSEKFGEDNGVENRMWYFREDIQVNAQHWFWHLTYPFNRTFRSDRRGELFYYFHHQIITRYNTDRLANGLARTENIRLDPTFVMKEGYIPHLNDPVSDVDYLPRKPNTPFPPYVDGGHPTLSTLITWNERLIQSINYTTFVYQNATVGPITAVAGFDSLVDAVESSVWSVNKRYYGSLHNNGHTYIAFSSVWSNPNATVYGVMEDVSTSMRDPTFYQWHGYLDDLFLSFKKKLKPYKLTEGDFPLVWSEVRLGTIDVLPGKTLSTFWSLKNLTLTRRLDLDAGIHRGPFDICAKHLNHDRFKYKLSVELSGSTSRNATVRIFMAPRFNEDGQRFSLEEQMRWFFAMDAFKTTLAPRRNTLLRDSVDSTLTIPWGRTSSGLEGNLTINRAFCGVGWPDHLLLPKGSPKGTVYDLVVMLTDTSGDTVGDEDVVVPQACEPAYILGGIWLKKYPDRKPMGYPFDRQPFKKYKDLEEFVGMIPNMATTQITIVHQNKFMRGE